MALESIAWPSPPEFTDLVDGDQSYNMGIRFSHEDGGPCWGVEWRVPDSVPPPAGGVHAVSIWDVATETRVAYQEFVPVPGGLQSIEFDTKPVLDPAPALYIAAVYTLHYVFRARSVNPVLSPSGKIVADDGRLTTFNGGAPLATFPNDTFASWYYVSPIMDDGGSVPPNEGSAALGLDLTVAATGARDSAGSAALGLGLGVAATGARDSEGAAAVGLGLAVAATGSAPHGGSVALTLDLALAGAGERDSLGAAALGLGLAVSGAGARGSAGSAALGLNLAVAATGSNGDVGCPVPPFPFTPRSGLVLPWAPRAVRSFPGGECT